MWRTVIVTKEEKLTLRDNWLVVYSDHNEQRVPLGDIYSVVIDNRAALVSVSLMAALAEANIHVIFCDNKHIPTALMLPMNTHYKPFGVIKRQLALSENFKAILWQRIVQQKLNNQIICLKLAGVNNNEIEPIEQMYSEVLPDDSCRIIEAHVPPKGSVRVLTVTEKQYDSMKLFVGERLKTENLLDKKDIIEL